MAQSKRWCFTLYNYPALDLYRDELAAQPGVVASVFQREICPSTGREHLQGFVLFSSPKRFGSVQRIFPGAHLEAARGSISQNVDYCTKDDTRDPRPGSGPLYINGEAFLNIRPGHRTDLEDAAETARIGGLRAVASQHPASFIRYHAGLAAYVSIMQGRPSDTDYEPNREWQAGLLEHCQHPADDRQIVWVYDRAGCKGKSKLATHLILEHNAVELSGKVADMAYAYDSQPIVIFDITRTQADHMNHLYQFAEQLKNGRIFSTKYQPVHKYFPAPHVIFFANFQPDPVPWTGDRMLLLDLSDCEPIK